MRVTTVTTWSTTYQLAAHPPRRQGLQCIDNFLSQKMRKKKRKPELWPPSNTYMEAAVGFI